VQGPSVQGLGSCGRAEHTRFRCARADQLRTDLTGKGQACDDDPSCKNSVVVQGLDSCPRAGHASPSFNGWTARPRQDGQGLIQRARADRLCKRWTWKGEGTTQSCAHTPSPVQERCSPVIAGALEGSTERLVKTSKIIKTNRQPCLLNHVPKGHSYMFFEPLQGW